MCNTIFAQNFLYKREVKGIKNSKQTEWYKLEIPIEVVEKTNTDFSDIRIFGVSDLDTLETPFLTRKIMQQAENKQVDFKVINSSKKGNDYFFTLEKEENNDESINLIKLNFQNTNFDWKIKLEGSQNQNEWFEVLDEYRIVSIKNDFTDYKFTNLVFPNSKYKYYRIKITDKSESQSDNNNPILSSANVFQQKTVDGNFQNIEIISQHVEVDKVKKQTVIDIELAHSAPIDFISLGVKNDFDYYRTIQFKYLLDSTQTEKGVIYNFVTLHTSTLSSIEKQNGKSDFFINSSTKSNHYQIIISNQDNQPLDIGNIEIKSYVNQLFTRVAPTDKNLTYFLMYGNERLQKPNYDIVRFESTIPNDIISLELESEQKIPQKEVEKVTPLFENSLWLWLLMGTIILVLTVFTFKMMKKQ
ncbi:hypothetical protein Fleli_3384 [Bernardetia litoralis DSM 6794]|uniref:DUF3999 domain-containing protein n=1 Tax=Bernardetia litoralis (strain ATCC 23117 / DSM 6794 / NBRC 15988 / NCIMB 1366 / Fx l1 / Sio-4) TaxID=880071 RepID=I4AP23_BERLS|nr:hypothetical protein Fleli_3384 [Bernardetia litoralis DSM 6794]